MTDYPRLWVDDVAPAMGDRGPREEQGAEPACTVCPPSWAVHDALGRRFCTAIREVGWSRGWICR
jgi:hypothetical protein